MLPVHVHDNLFFNDHWIRMRERDEPRIPEFPLKKQK
tara:strand:- start:59761 stop:59871 length:111 start_codon:yes stop_codon:yes gene_type:complete